MDKLKSLWNRKPVRIILMLVMFFMFIFLAFLRGDPPERILNFILSPKGFFLFLADSAVIYGTLNWIMGRSILSKDLPTLLGVILLISLMLYKSIDIFSKYY